MSTPVQDHGSTPAAVRQSGRHPVNVGHLVMGVAFLGLVGIWGLYQGDVVDTGNVRWLLPVPWVLAGVAGLLAIGLSSSRRWTTRQTGWVGPDAPVAPVAPIDASDTGLDPAEGPTDGTTTEIDTETTTEDPTEENR